MSICSLSPCTLQVQLTPILRQKYTSIRHKLSSFPHIPLFHLIGKKINLLTAGFGGGRVCVFGVGRLTGVLAGVRDFLTGGSSSSSSSSLRKPQTIEPNRNPTPPPPPRQGGHMLVHAVLGPYTTNPTARRQPPSA